MLDVKFPRPSLHHEPSFVANGDRRLTVELCDIQRCGFGTWWGVANLNRIMSMSACRLEKDGEEEG